jgi:hypothetical protein
MPVNVVQLCCLLVMQATLLHWLNDLRLIHLGLEGGRLTHRWYRGLPSS